MLFHTQMIRAGGFRHTGLPVFYFADICMAYGYGLILSKRIGAQLTAVYGDGDISVVPFLKMVNAQPEDQGQNQNSADK